MKSDRKNSVKVQTKQVLYWTHVFHQKTNGEFCWAHASRARVTLAVTPPQAGPPSSHPVPEKTHRPARSGQVLRPSRMAKREGDNVCNSCLAHSQALTGMRHRKCVCACVYMRLLGLCSPPLPHSKVKIWWGSRHRRKKTAMYLDVI